MTPEVARPIEPRQAADAEIELAALRASLELAEGFAILFAVCNEPRRRDQMIQQLCDELAANPPVVVDLPQPIVSLLDELAARPDAGPRSPLFVCGLERSLPNADDAFRERLVANLNAARDALSRTVSCPLVLWVPEYALHAIQRGAPDFFSIHSGVYQFGQPYDMTTTLVRRDFAADEDQMEGTSAAEKAARLAGLERLLSEYQSRPTDRRDQRAEAALLARLAYLYGRVSRLTDAESTGRRAFTLTRQLYGPSDPRVASCVNNIGSVLQDKGDLEGALQCYREAERIDRAAFGDDHPKVASDVNNIGSVLQDKGDLEGALQCLREAERIDRAAFIDDHPNVATDVNNIGSVLRAKGDLEGALQCYREAFTTMVRRRGPRSLSAIRGAKNLIALDADPFEIAKEVAGDEAAAELKKAIEESKANRAGRIAPDSPRPVE